MISTIIKLLGHKWLNFKDEAGSEVKGTQLFVSFPEDGVTGEIVDKLFFRDGTELPPLTPGMNLDVTYNRKGRVVAIKAAPKG